MEMVEESKPGRTRKRFVIQRGLYSLRYEEAEDSVFPPSIYVSTSEPGIEFIWPPGTKSFALHRPGTGLAIRTNHPGELTIEVVASVFEGSTNADIRFEGLSDQSDVELAKSPYRVAVATAQPQGVLLRGHLASIGDVLSNGNGWLGGPKSPSRIEAIAIQLGETPAGSTFVYGARTARQPLSQPIKMVDAGKWIGSKGRGEPIVALHLELRHSGPPTYELRGEAMFLGAVPRPFAGLSVDLRGASGREPLVGLKLNVCPLAATATASTQLSSPTKTTAVPLPKQEPPPQDRGSGSTAEETRQPATSATVPVSSSATAPQAAATFPAAEKAIGPKPKRVRVFRA